MMRKLRIFLAALLLVPVLASNASAFSADSDGALNPARQQTAVCYFYWNGSWVAYPC
jgi:hypothetical protein